ncbi:hypothetical protein B5X24_HaOG216261 [Helicoverpa armigera]|nr:hypothetical protein B5X24_HaOG216261 [Helicoverpa armigera]
MISTQGRNLELHYFEERITCKRIMDSANVLCQMAQYDFNCPIDVTMIFEDSDDDSQTRTSEDPQKEENEKDNTNVSSPHTNVSGRSNEPECCKENENTKCKSECRSLEQLIINKITDFVQKEKPVEGKLNGEKADKPSNDNNLGTNAINQNKDSPIDKLNIPNENVHTFNVGSNADIEQSGNKEPVLSKSQTKNKKPEITFLEDLLNKVSEHLVLIMRTFCHYGAKRANQGSDSENRQRIFHFVRNHFFELSFHTVETIILPQEHNTTFMNQFLEKTVEIANQKSQPWVCHRGHVRPFLMDLIRWTKQRIEYNTKNEQRPKRNENAILKQHLATPPQIFNLPQTQSINLQNCNASPTIQNNLCIFSSGVPGGEISINVNSNLLRNVTEPHYTSKEYENNNYNSYSPNGVVTQGSTSAPTLHESQYSYMQNNNTTYNRPPPPYTQKNLNKFTQMLRQSNKKNKNMRQHHHQQQHYKEQISPTANIPNQQATSYQNYQSMAQPMPNYQNQVHYINGSQSPTDNSLNSRLHYNINASTQENPMNSGPVISNVISYAQKSATPSDRCTMCGKITSAPYIHPNRPVYCSYLCQELDKQFYTAQKQPAWACNS